MSNRIISGSNEPEMSLICSTCSTEVRYYLSDIMGADDKKVRCEKCLHENRVMLPNYIMVQMENGRPILRLDLGLVLTESALTDPQVLLSAWISYINQITLPLTKGKEKYLSELPERYHQNWWPKSSL